MAPGEPLVRLHMGLPDSGRKPFCETGRIRISSSPGICIRQEGFRPRALQVLSPLGRRPTWLPERPCFFRLKVGLLSWKLMCLNLLWRKRKWWAEFALTLVLVWKSFWASGP